MTKVAIIGAGIGGLATACLLAKAGYEVTIYEKNDAAGGRAGTLEVDGFRFDTGPSWYLMPEVFDHFFSLFGINADKLLDIIRLDPGYKVFFEHQPSVTVGANPAANRALFESIEKGAGSQLDRYVGDSVFTYHSALEYFLYTNFTSLRDYLRLDFLRTIPRLTKLAFGHVDAYVSKRFHDQRLRQILEYPMVFLGASPYDAPAIYTLMSALDFESGVYYPKRGMYSLIDELVSLARSLHVTISYGDAVQQIATLNGKVKGIALASGAKIEADIVISNADLHFTETQLLASRDQTYPERYWSKRNPGPSALLLYLGVRGDLSALAHHSLLFVDQWRENFEAIYRTKEIPEHASLYLSRATATDPGLAPAGHEALVVLVPLPSGIALSDPEKAALAKRTIQQIARMTGITDLEKRIVSQTIRSPQDFGDLFNAWGYGALGPAHTLRQSAIFRTSNQSRKVKNLYYVGGSTLPGIGLPMCLISAQLVYKRLIGDRRGGKISRIQPLEEKK